MNITIKEARENAKQQENVSTDINGTIGWFNENLRLEDNFDIIYRVITVGGKKACFYYIDGFCKDDLMQKMLQFFYSITPEDMPDNAHEMCKKYMPYVEIDLARDKDVILQFILSGVLAFFVDGFDQCILIDCRTYPARDVSEPEKDKTMRGSKDGFVETLIFNTALVRRRIRDTNLCMKMMNAGAASKTDIVVCYMENRVDKAFLERLVQRIENIKVDALTMSQESLAECIYHRKWFNPFPKFKYTERPDTATAQVLEGDVIILVDNSPQAMIIPTSIFDIIEEADDYYFPPITGTYLRLSRMLIALLTFLIPPTFLLLMMNPEWIPSGFAFIQVKETINVPLIWQFLILELAIDGLRLAAVNTPNMLSTPLSILAGLVLGEFSVQSGWFNAEVMLYMAFVAVSTYTQANYELGYALKFMCMIALILTAIFGVFGYIAGIVVCVAAIVSNRTVADKSYVYPLIPFHFKVLCKRLFRMRMSGANDGSSKSVE